MGIEIEPQKADLFDGFRNGSLHIYLVRDPDGWRGEPREDAFYMECRFPF